MPYQRRAGYINPNIPGANEGDKDYTGRKKTLPPRPTPPKPFIVKGREKLLSYDAGNEAGTGLGPGSQSAAIGRMRQNHNVVSTTPRKGGAVGQTPFDRFVSKSHPATSPKVAVAPFMDQSMRLRS